MAKKSIASALPEIAMLIRLLKKALRQREMVDCETREALIEQQPHRAWGMARHCRQPKPPRRPALAEYLRPLALGIRASVRHGQDRRRVLQALGGRQDGDPVCRARRSSWQH